jgi:2-dehydro-3-deoxyphosphogluconate aldolase/(4S)-4-hydroxy-2-oxoglutarate aldolase
MNHAALPLNDETPALPPALRQLRKSGLLAVLRGSDPEGVAQAARVLVGAGITVLEVTFTVPNCAAVIRDLKGDLEGAVIGAGTVTNAAQLHQATQAGADFVVTPGVTPHLLTELSTCPVPYLPGVLTPSEVMAAREAGAIGVKLFPGSSAGPSGLKGLLGPFPDLRVVPTGGVNPDNVGEWFRAGAFALGAGSDLAPVSAVDSRDHDRLKRNAAVWLAAVHAAGRSEPENEHH